MVEEDGGIKTRRRKGGRNKERQEMWSNESPERRVQVPHSSTGPRKVSSSPYSAVIASLGIESKIG